MWNWSVLILTWPSTCIITDSRGVETFTITDTKLFVLIVALSTQTQDNVKLLDQLKFGFKRTVNWNNQFKVSIETQNPYLHYLLDPTLQWVNRLFV